MSDVQSICIPSFRDWYLEIKFWATGRRYSYRLWILWTRTIRILFTIDLNEPRHAQHMHKSMEETSEHGILGRHQSCSKERIEVLSDSIECYHSSWTHFQLIVFRKLLWWKLEKSYTRKYMRHPRPPFKDLLETWLDERIGFRSCWTTRGTSCSTI